MKLKLNHDIIRELCGSVSFKKGDSFYRANKVTFEKYREDECTAIVKGGEDFRVSIACKGAGKFQTACSCPKLPSFTNDCQHIAAVLLALYDHQQKGTTPIVSDKPDALTEGLLTLFNEQPARASGSQSYFENRQVLQPSFTCKRVAIGKGQNLLCLEMEVDTIPILNVREFLASVGEGRPYSLSATMTYDSNLHCFQAETDAIIRQLIQVEKDEKAFVATLANQADGTISPSMLLIPPSSWERLISLLVNTPMVKLAYRENLYEGLHLSEQKLPLLFNFSETEGEDYELKVAGLKHVIVLEPYQTVLSGGNVVRLNEEDCNRLSELKRMLDRSSTNRIPISPQQLSFFLEKVVPGLKKLGDVNISPMISKQFLKTPLIAKLYLDRLKNRLLAGLEFHYEHVVVNPLMDRELPANSGLVRDVDKEEEILELMESSLFAKTEGGYFLHNEELEYEFLYHVIPKLQPLVQIYATTAIKNRIFKGNAFPKMRIKVKRERTNWLEFKFEMDGIRDHEIREVLAALEEKRKYYRLRNGSLLSLETREMEEIQRFLHSLPVEQPDFEQGIDLPIIEGLRLLESIEDEQQLFTMEESFRKFLQNLRNPNEMDFTVPELLDPTLRDYQRYGYKWMKTLSTYGFGGILADDMGLGKTLQSITYILSELPEIRKSKQPVLIVCPSSLTYNWLNELAKFTPNIQAMIVDGVIKARVEKRKEAMQQDVIITSYPLLVKDRQWFEKQAFHTIFFDEAQAFKNPATQTAKAVKRLQARVRFALSGTPVENALEELWSIFYVVFPDLFKGFKEFSNLPRKTIARRIRPFLLRRIKEDVLSELPEKMEQLVSMELLPEQKKLYGAYLAKLRHDTLKHLNKETIRKNRIKILAGLTRLRQICCHPSLFVDGYQGSSAKMEQLLQIVEESRISGRRVLIFSQFTKMLGLIGRELAGRGHAFFYLDGQTPAEDRVNMCQRFNEGEGQFFLISLKAGGTGLNLTGADTVILYDLWWNPAVEEQAADRAHRIGQTNVVQVIKLVARGTIEEKINELQEKKKHLIEEIIDPKEKMLASLTEEDIREILR
ncbi:DEAD/DEAH box helicase [Lederbergia citrea]|uniref:DEAD/DEAH box helicase n=1 Tax=Lederbergia citrea TaxID=2833581 RepID=UPI001BCA11E9|nr:DEAD/DEAH box helicase [Lederbergia citrea]MBS4177769.1 DEAD/DEAH box helicase [Lederbergia citrea]